jgi:hypothetical protein
LIRTVHESTLNGASTVLLERYGHLGGMATGGLVLVIMPMSDGTADLILSIVGPGAASMGWPLEPIE